MKFLEWNNKRVGNYDIFMITNKYEVQKIVQYFDSILALSCTYSSNLGEEEYYYFLNTELKTITPMPDLTLAFGGMYNGYPPYGEEIKDIEFVVEEYSLTFNDFDERIKCPKCGSSEVAKILYGMPVFHLIEEDLEKGKIELGGCCITDNDPAYKCRSCNHKFGNPYDYENIVEISFSDGGYFGGYKTINFAKYNNTYFLCTDHSLECNPKKKEISAFDWYKVVSTLYDQFFIAEWDKEYNNPDVLDGEQWELTIKFNDGNIVEYWGSNAYPKLFEELTFFFEEFCRALENNE